MMDNHHHKLLSPLLAAVGVIYELVYRQRHVIAIACSSLQHEEGCSWQQGWALLRSSTEGRQCGPPWDSTRSCSNTSWSLMGSQELKNNINKAAAVLKGPELQRCYFLNQVELLSTSSQAEFLGKKKGALCGINAWGFAL